jgi:hypothetical protein
LIKNLQKTPSAEGIPLAEKVPFLLAWPVLSLPKDLLWANKENEQYNC